MVVIELEYSYPFSTDWTTEEVIAVINFFQSIEKAYESGISKSELMKRYRDFKQVVPSKGEEKRICNEFEEVSGYSSYRTIEKMKKSDDEAMIKM